MDDKLVNNGLLKTFTVLVLSAAPCQKEKIKNKIKKFGYSVSLGQ